MKFLAHRGFWIEPEEKNTSIAFERTFKNGFGLETDIRDLNGELVIAHDPPQITQNPLKFDDFLNLYSKHQAYGLTLALNIKSNGLASKLLRGLTNRGMLDYFVFDLSVPDALAYLGSKAKVFTRQSEYEAIPPFLNEATGVWMDEFHHHWITTQTLFSHLEKKKLVAIVSPELHGRPHQGVWEAYKNMLSTYPQEWQDKVMLCTDLPLEARRFFHGN